MITIYDKDGAALDATEVLQDLPITKDCQHVEEMMKSDYVALSWHDTMRYILPVGAYIVPFPTETNPDDETDSRYPLKYRLFEEYDPDGRSETEYEYQPQFEHPVMWLSRLPFFLATGDISSWTDALKKTSWGYTGSVIHIAGYVTDAINWLSANYPLFGQTFGTGWTAFVDSDLSPSVTVTFESVSIFSAASAIAEACDCEFHFDFARKQLRLGTIRYGEEVTLESGVNVGVANISRTKKDFHNAFLIKGSTRNLSQPTDTGENVQLRERLTLDTTDYPDSMMYTDGNGNIINRQRFLALGIPMLMEELIFDDIYPKLELYIYNVRERKCWLLDDEGRKIEDANGEEAADGKKYKTYSKWYLRLAYPIYNAAGEITSWRDYTLSEHSIIDGQTLQMTFLPNSAAGAYNSLLIGQGDFDMVYFSEQTTELEEDDMNPSGFTAQVGDYRIVFKQQDNLIIPTTSNGGLYPLPVGTSSPSLLNNKATLLNIVVSDDYKKIAQQELEKVALRKVRLDLANLNNYTLPSNPVSFEENGTRLHIGQSVVYVDGENMQLQTHVIRIVTQLDYPFEQEITVGNEKVRTNIATLQEQVQTIIAGLGNSGLMDENEFSQLIFNYGSRYFLSKTHDDTAKGFIRFIKGLQVGERFVTGLLGEGGVFRKESDGTTYIEADKLYIRLKAYFDTVEIREYRHSAGNRIASPAGARCNRVSYIDAGGNTVQDASDAVKFRCFFRAKDGENEVRNNFVIGDQAYCHITSVETASDSQGAKGLNQKHYWRLVIGRSVSPDDNGNHWIDLSNRASETLTIGGSTYTHAGYQAGSDVPASQDDIVQLGNINDTSRQGAIIEFVTGADSPSYQIYQGISDFSLTGKNYIGLGYSTQTGRAYMNVYGDAFIGDPSESSFIRYNSQTKKLEIKAEVSIQSTFGGKTLDEYIEEHSSDWTEEDIVSLITDETDPLFADIDTAIENIQKQVDGQIMTWYYNGTPTLNNLPAIEWETTTDKDNHIGDLYYDKATGHAYRFMYDNDTRSYVWTPIPDQDIAKALGKAQDAQDTADSKRRIFVRQPLNSEEYDVGDLWVNATYPSGNTTSDPTHGLYYNDILRCMTHKDADVAFSIAHWGLSSRYTDDSALTSFLAGYTSTLTGIRNDISAAQTSADNAAALAAAADYLKQAFLDNTGQAQTTDITGGLVLSTIVALRDANRKVWSGINGSYQENETGTGYKGHGIAAWYGGGMVDHEVTPSAQNYAKSLFRFDGSGYVASGNLTWDANGNVTLQGVSINAETLQKDGVGVATTNDLTSYLTKTDATNTYLSIAFFKRLFQAYNGTTAVNPNDTSTTIDSIKAMFGFWTEQYVSALGKNSSGGSGTTLTLNEPLASINNASLGTPSESGVGLVWDGTKWTFGRTSGSGDYLPLSGGMMSGVIRFGTGESNIVTYSGDAVTYNGETVTFGSGSGGSIYSATSSILAPTFSSLASMVIKSAWGISFADESDYIGAFVDVKNGILGVRTRLGIGTDSPTYPLHVSGTGFVSGTLTAGAFVRSSGTPSQFLKADGSVDSNAYATESWVTEKGYLTSASLDGYATQTWVTNKGYITPSALSGYATESWVTKKGYITASTLADYLPLTGGNITGNLNVSGSVGIGTTSPSYKLHVNGSLFSSGLTCSGGMAVSGAATLSSTLSVSGATTISNTLSVTGLITASGGITIPSGKTLTIGDAVLSWDSVNQGIKISKGVYSEIFVSALGANSSQGGSNISLNEPLASINSASLGTPSSSGMGLVWNGTKWTYQSVTGDSSSGTIQGNLYITGSVGIGTTPSIYKLHVMGTALVTGGTKLGSICIECDSNGANFSSTSGEINRYDSTLYLQYGTTANLSMCQGGGYVAIGGSVQNGIRLKVYGATQTRSLNVNGFEVSYENGGYEINTDGTKVTVDSTWYGTFQSSSDARLKNVIDYPSVSVEEIANAPIVNFKWFDNKDNDTHLGTIAQYWKSVTPHGVSQMPNGYLAMDYGAIALASAVSVAKRVLNLEERVRHLENENRILKEQLKAA